MVILPSTVAAFKAHAAAVWPTEACGYVDDSGFVACPNLAIDPRIDFRISPAAFASGRHVVAILHSHTHSRGTASGELFPRPNDFPSVADQKAQAASGLPWGISCVSRDAVGGVHVADPFFFGDQVEIPPLVGRPFRHAVTDCYSLIRDWYRLNRAVTLPNFGRDDMWWSKGGNLYLDHFAAAGFRVIDPKDIAEGDVFLARVGTPVPAHGGVFIGGGLVMDHPRGRLSGCRPVSVFQRFGHQITHWLRHESTP